MLTTLKQLTGIFIDSIARCENCGKSEDFYYCDDCKDNIIKFEDMLSQLLIGTIPDPNMRLLMMLEIADLLPDLPIED